MEARCKKKVWFKVYFSVQNVFWIQNGQTLTSPNLRKLYLTCPSSKILYSKPIQNLFGHKVWAKKKGAWKVILRFLFPLGNFPSCTWGPAKVLEHDNASAVFLDTTERLEANSSCLERFFPRIINNHNWMH